MSKIEKTWSLNEKTVLLAKVLAAVFQVTDSQLIENIIITKSIRTHAFLTDLGIRQLPSSKQGGNWTKGDKVVRKTVALTEETYERFKRIADVTERRESIVVESFIYDTANTVNSFYPKLEDLVDMALWIRKGNDPEDLGQEVLYEIYHGKLTESESKKIYDSIASLKTAFRIQ